MVERPGTAPGTGCLQGIRAAFRAPRCWCRELVSSQHLPFFRRTCEPPSLSRHGLERPAGNDPASIRWQRIALPLSYGRMVGNPENRTRHARRRSFYRAAQSPDLALPRLVAGARSAHAPPVYETGSLTICPTRDWCLLNVDIHQESRFHFRSSFRRHCAYLTVHPWEPRTRLVDLSSQPRRAAGVNGARLELSRGVDLLPV